jgi:uncharacterized protein
VLLGGVTDPPKTLSMFTCNEPQLNNLLLGASVLATGGGCCYETKKTFLKDLKQPIELFEADDFGADELLCTVYAVGSTSLQETNFDDALRSGCAQVEAYAGQKLSALFVGELGAEHLAIRGAMLCNLKVVDADGTGGRAVPEIVQDMFALHNMMTTPAIVIDAEGRSTIFEELSPTDLEIAVRDIARKTNGLVLVFDHIMQAKNIGLLSCGNLKKSMKIGAMVHEKHFNHLGSVGIDLIDEARITRVTEQHGTDFFRATVVLDGLHGVYEILIQNENLVLLKGGQPMVTCPHLIMLLDQNGQPVHNSELDRHLNTTVTILASKATPPWQTVRGHELFHPRRFGFDYEVAYL